MKRDILVLKLYPDGDVISAVAESPHNSSEVKLGSMDKRILDDKETWDAWLDLLKAWLTRRLQESFGVDPDAISVIALPFDEPERKEVR